MIYILGGTGFVGSSFARVCQLQSRPFRVIGRTEYREATGSTCSVLINANGNSMKYLADRSPLDEFDASVRTVRASLVDFHYDAYVLLSSSAVYPDCSSPKTTWEGWPLDETRQSTYGFHKYLAELCVRHVARRNLIVRMGGFVGPGLKKNAIYDLLNGAPLWLDLESELQFMHTDTLATIVLDLVDRALWGEVFNVCGRGLVRLREVADALGRPIVVQPGSPRLRHDVNIRKISSITEVPDTRETVLDFIHNEVASV